MWQETLFSLLILTSSLKEDVFASHSFIVRMDLESSYGGDALQPLTLALTVFYTHFSDFVGTT